MEGLLEEGIFELPKLKEAGWLTDIKYEDEVFICLLFFLAGCAYSLRHAFIGVQKLKFPFLLLSCADGANVISLLL